jgi:hypothetical protein
MLRERVCSVEREVQRMFETTEQRIARPVRESYLRFGAEQRGYTLPPRLLASGVEEYETELQLPVQQL